MDEKARELDELVDLKSYAASVLEKVKERDQFSEVDVRISITEALALLDAAEAYSTLRAGVEKLAGDYEGSIANRVKRDVVRELRALLDDSERAG